MDEPKAKADDKPKSAAGWLKAIKDAEKAFADYQAKCDNIDKLYADLSRLASNTRDRQFQMFWANIEVLGPSIYARPPVPVVVPRFKDRKPLPRQASEILERCAITLFDREDIDAVMRSVRDDLTIAARGVAWMRYKPAGPDYATETVCIEHLDRKDFLTQPARQWKEVDWIARRGWLSKPEMRKRFNKHSGDAYLDAEYITRKSEDGHKIEDDTQKAGVWEIWCKSDNRCYWVNESVDVYLDDSEPELKLEGFFPCPRPAYATRERRTLIPVPDFAFYKDQLEEINELTGRIAALTDAVQVRGFYPAGAGEIGDAIEAAVKRNENNQVLIGVSNWAMIGTGGVKDMIVWLPVDQVVLAVRELIAIRKEVISDVYEVMGLSDIMRGSTEASETATAQQLKSQYGSIRIRDKQNELIRLARDIARIACEIMAENFSPDTLLAMSQMEIATEQDLAAQVAGLQQQADQINAQVAQGEQMIPQLLAQAGEDPQAQQQIQQQIEQSKQQAQQALQGLQEQANEIMAQPTIEKVVQLYRDQRMRPFVLDIETDSTIAPDENAQKQRAAEFVASVGGFLGQALPLLMQVPQAAPVIAETLKFVASQHRAGRQLDQVIDEFADGMKEMAKNPPPNPEAEKAKAEAQAQQAQQQVDIQKAQAETEKAKAEALAVQNEAMNAQSKAADDDLNRRVTEQKEMDAARQRQIETDAKARILEAEIVAKREKHSQEMLLGELEIELAKLKIGQTQVQTEATIATTKAGVDAKNQAAANSVATTQAGIEAKGDEAPEAKSDRLAEVTEALLGAVQALSRPKRIVRGPDGRPSHVETV
jgi:hypothetical protein